MIDPRQLQTCIDNALGTVLNAPLKGPSVSYQYAGSGPYQSPPLAMADFNAVSVLVVPPSGSLVTGDLHVQGSGTTGGFINVSDPNSVTVGITQRIMVDVTVGTHYVSIQLANIGGSPDPGASWLIVVTPYVSPGQTRVAASIVVDSLSAIQTLTGSLEVSGACMIDATGSISALGTGLSKLTIDSTGLKLFNSLGTQTGQLLDDGSGWLGSSSVLSWTTAGVVSLNGSAVSPGTIGPGATNFPSIPLISGLTFTNNSPVSGSVAWSACTLTIAGSTFSIAAGNTSTKYIYWKSSSPSAFQTSATPPANGTLQFLIAINSGGLVFQSIFGNIIYADYISATTLAAIQANIGACNISDVLTIGTSGGLYQGTGTFAAPTTGLKIFNSGGIGTLATYNAGVLEVQLDTTGKLVAGAGKITIGASGINIAGSNGANSLALWGDPAGQNGFIYFDSFLNLFTFSTGSVSNPGTISIDFYQSGHINSLSLDGAGLHLENNGTDVFKADLSGNLSATGSLTLNSVLAAQVDGSGNLNLLAGSGGNILFKNSSGALSGVAYSSGGFYIGIAPSDPGQNNLRVQGAIALAKIATPGTIGTHGQLFVDTSGNLHYRGPNGTNTQLAVA